jgi:putative tryptophan/tyrosine transport system substrate-binding protein
LSDALRPHGFIEGHNLAIDYCPWAAHVDHVAEYATDLVKARVDAISAGGNVAIRAAQHATKTIPILGVTDDMVGSGFVSSMARPSVRPPNVR